MSLVDLTTLSGTLDTAEAVMFVGMGVALVVLAIAPRGGARRLDVLTRVFLALAGIAALGWKGSFFFGLSEDTYPFVESLETVMFLLLSGAMLAWTSAVFARHAAALESANTRLDAALKDKQTYLDILGHDVKNPLTAARLRLYTLTLGDEKTKRVAQATSESIDRALAIVEDSLLYSKLESGDQLSRTTVDLSAMAGEATRALRPLAQAKDVTVRIEGARPAPARASPLLERAIENLAANAVKWSKNGSEVTVAIERAATGWTMKIVDHGPGIAAEDRPKLFARFARVDKSGVSGTGLGLAIAGRLVDAHGGQISIEDTPGGGATFVILLPESATVSELPSLAAPRVMN
ncbi:MAG: sensor histidine kinase [Thermoplasmatota archaeon]